MNVLKSLQNAFLRQCGIWVPWIAGQTKHRGAGSREQRVGYPLAQDEGAPKLLDIQVLLGHRKVGAELGVHGSVIRLG